MNTVNIADLKNRLSAYLQQVRGGEEIVVRDRNLPIAKLIPLTPAEVSSEEMALAAAGKLRLPSELLDEESFWRGEQPGAAAPELARSARRAVSAERERSDARLLGR